MGKKVKHSVAPAAVRAWARENGHTVGVKGKLPPTVIEAFNAAHPETPYFEGVHAEAAKKIVVTGVKTLDSGKKIPVRRTTTVNEVRLTAQAAGINVGRRGRLTPDVLTAFAVGQLDAATA
jgi:hypothetical protein